MSMQSSQMPTKPSALTRLGVRSLNTVTGLWKEALFYDGRAECLALIHGEVAAAGPTLCRIHSDCLSSHVSMSVECDCRDQMLLAQECIVRAGSGVILVLPQDGRGFGHQVLMAATELAHNEDLMQTEAYRAITGRSDGRDYRSAASMLYALGVREVDLLTNNPDKVQSLTDLGIRVASAIPLVIDDLYTRPELQDSYRDKVFQGHKL